MAMRIIQKCEGRTMFRTTCPTCKSIVEGDPDDDFRITGLCVGARYVAYLCPVCQKPQQVTCLDEIELAYRFKKILYYVNKDGSLGEEICQ